MPRRSGPIFAALLSLLAFSALGLTPYEFAAVGLPTVILAGEVEPDTTLYDQLRDQVPEVHAVGDCTGLGLIRKATLEGAQVANAL